MTIPQVGTTLSGSEKTVLRLCLDHRLLVPMDAISDVLVDNNTKFDSANIKNAKNVPDSQKKLLKELKATLEILEIGVAQEMKPLVGQALEIVTEIEKYHVTRQLTRKISIQTQRDVSAAVRPPKYLSRAVLLH